MNISEHLCATASILKCNFTLRNQPLTAKQVFSETGLLPGIMKRANQLAKFCFGQELGLSYENVTGSMQGVRVVFDDSVSNGLRLFCAIDILIELMQNAPNFDQTPLDDLMYD